MSSAQGAIDVTTQGRFQLSTGGNVVALPKSRKCRALFAYLAVSGEPQRRTHLIGMFYSEVADPKGGLRWAISQLRRCLPAETVLADRQTVSVDVKRLNVDLDEAESLVADHAPLDQLKSAEALLQGEFLGDLALSRAPEFESWRLAQSVRTNHRRVLLLKQLIERTLGTSEAVEYARRLTDLDVTSEVSWATLIKTYQALEQHTEAAKVLDLAHRQLRSHGLSPGPALIEVAPVVNAPDSAPTNSALILDLRPRLVVLDCRTTDKRLTKRALDVTEAVYRAASVNKSGGVVSREVSRQLHSDDQPIFEQLQRKNIDFVLEATMAGSGVSPVLEVGLIEVERGTCIHNWRIDVDAEDHHDYLVMIETILSARFEIDFYVSMVDIAREKSVCSGRDYFLLALPKIFSAAGFDPQAAYELLSKAVSHQPHFGEAYCVTALIRMFLPQFNDTDDQIAKTLMMARQAVEICQDDAFVLGMSAAVIMHLDKQSATGRSLAERALTLNPYSIVGCFSMAVLMHYSGEDDSCTAYLDRIERYVDTQPVTFVFDTIRCMVAFQQSDYHQAIEWANKAIGQNPKYIVAIRYYLASLGHLGQTDHARPIAEQLFALDSSENIAFFRRRSAYRIDELTERLCEGLRLGGLPETP